MEFLAVIEIIALFFFGKFIYDTYITDNTDKNWEKYQKNYPESSARIGGKGLNFSTPSVTNQNQKITSYIFLANNLNCAPEHVEAIYTTDLRKNISHSSQALALAKNWEKEKCEQSKQLNIDPDDTSASLLETWTMTVFNDLKRSENMSSKDDEDEIEEQDEDEYEDDEDSEEDEEEEIEHLSRIITYYNSIGIKVNQSQKADVIEILGQPDIEPKRGVSVNVMSYKKKGLEFLYVYNDGVPVIVSMTILRDFSIYFPEINESNDEDITLNSVMNAYGEVYVSTCSYSGSKEEFYRIHYDPFFVFESVTNENKGRLGTQKLKSINIGGFDGGSIGPVYYTN